MSGNSEITKWLIQLRDIIISGTGKPAEVGNAIRDIIEEEGSISEKDLPRETTGLSVLVLVHDIEESRKDIDDILELPPN